MKKKICTLTQNCSGSYLKNGHFYRKSDSRYIQRYRCKNCRKYTSNATKSDCYRQNKRQINHKILKLLCASVSQRRIALLLGVSRLTVERKFLFLSKKAARQNKSLKRLYFENKVKKLYLDEMEDRIHTKCKPTSIALIVTAERKVVDFEVARIRPKTPELYKLSKEKYPGWEANSFEKFEELIERNKVLFEKTEEILSDQKPNYSFTLKKKLPHANHIRHRSRRAVVAGQGELKEGGRDPLFPLNHTCAMLRANINRLIRRTWCTSKKLERLKLHIELYVYYHNQFLTG